MSSLTPQERASEVTRDSTYEGLVNGFATLIPAGGAMYAALQYPSFRARTNVQARTAMVIMPALFAFAWTAEKRLESRMKEVADETRHSTQTIQWAERQLAHKAKDVKEDFDTNAHLKELYEQSIAQSGVSVVPGDQLTFYHKAANYAKENPVKVLAGGAIPVVLGIFYGRSGKEHLELSSKLMHTRVFGQFATISLLLSVMGFKEYMDRNGKFVTEAEVRDRVEEMHRIRTELMERLKLENEAQEEARRNLQEIHAELEAAKKQKKQKNKATVAAHSSSPDSAAHVVHA